jgi:hypothetical protein
VRIFVVVTFNNQVIIEYMWEVLRIENIELAAAQAVGAQLCADPAMGWDSE